MKIKLKNGIWEDNDPILLKGEFVTIMYVVAIIQTLNIAFQAWNPYMTTFNGIVLLIYGIIIYTKHRYDKQQRKKSED